MPADVCLYFNVHLLALVHCIRTLQYVPLYFYLYFCVSLSVGGKKIANVSSKNKLNKIAVEGAFIFLYCPQPKEGIMLVKYKNPALLLSEILLNEHYTARKHWSQTSFNLCSIGVQSVFIIS